MENRYNPSTAAPRRPWKRRKPTPDLTKSLQFVTTSSSTPVPNPATDVRGNQILAADVRGNYSAFAVKMMLKMGYKAGSGLGKHEQGIVAPIQAKLRPKNLGMGFEEKSHKTVVQKEKKKVVRRCRGGRFQGMNKRKRTPGFMTDYEVHVMNGDTQIGGARGLITIVPQASVRWDSDNAGAVRQEKKENLVLEVLHNAPLAVDSEEDVPSDCSDEEVPVPSDYSDEEVRLDQNVLINDSENVPIGSIVDVPVDLGEQMLRMHRELRLERGKLVNEFSCRVGVKEIIDNELQRVEEDLLSGALTVDSLLTTFRYLKEQFEEEYKHCNLSIIVFSFAYPLLVEEFEGWEPLQNPMHGMEIISLLRDLLQGEQHCDQIVVGSSLYELLVSEVVLPAVTDNWQAWEPKPMLRFLESWGHLLSARVLESVLDKIVMPKLLGAVKSWDAKRESVPIYTWIHPWLPLLGERLEVLYDKISF